MLFRKAGAVRGAQAPEAPQPQEFVQRGGQREALLTEVARNVSQLGRNAAETRGQLEDTQKVVLAQAEAMGALAEELGQVQTAQRSISEATDKSMGAIRDARQALDGVGAEVGEIVKTLREVASSVSEITRIALQTRLVAFNASVEAKRAGEAGRGFGVVADAVKDLAGQVERSSKAIASTVGALDSKVQGLRQELMREDQASGRGGAQPGSAIHAAFQAVERDVSGMATSAQESERRSGQLEARANSLEQEIQTAMISLDTAFACSDSLLRMSEELIESMAGSGVDVEDLIYVQATQRAAEQVSQCLAQALGRGDISEAQLFDENYRLIEGTSPAQHLTAFVALADRQFPAIQDAALSLNDKVVFCIAVDRNGYVPTHNRQYCQPQRPGDVLWNTAHSRYRRIFNDRTGLASARNTRPFLLQTYRRDMGGGNHIILKEASAPITVAGRHWGAIRLAFKF